MTRTERATLVVAEEWCATLGVSEPAEGGDFFAEGGNSLMAVTMMERVEHRLGVDFPVEVMFLDGSYPAVLQACLDRVADLPGASG
jgi:Phosphopantetheine attachment site